MTVDELIMSYQRTHPQGHYFDDDTLRFFGERKSEMRIVGEVEHEDNDGNLVRGYMLKTIQHNHPLGTKPHYVFFDAEKFDPVSD